MGAPVLVLTVRGRVSRRPRSAPLVYARHRGGLVVAAANGGSDRPPQWWANLGAAGRARVAVGSKIMDVVPTFASGAQRDEAWSAFLRAYPPARHYSDLSGRHVPVVVLYPVAGDVP